METLPDLITNRGFDNYQNGIEARFDADKITYKVRYGKNKSHDSIIVNLEKDNKLIIIEICEVESMYFQYGTKNSMLIEQFINCSAEDFHTMLAHAFIYFRDGNFDYHKEWYNGLKRA